MIDGDIERFAYIICKTLQATQMKTNNRIEQRVGGEWSHLSKLKRAGYGGQATASGFALVATISVMVLLVMIALAMTSLATLELRSTRMAVAKEEARSNARMALMIAIGELQKHAGPDQSITAPAGILSSDGFASTEADLSKSRYTMVFNRRDRDDAETLLDDTNWKSSRQEFFRRFLVSGPQDEVESMSYAGTPINEDANTVKMSSRYTLDENEVYVQKEISKVDGRSNAYAWYVEGLGPKASMVLTQEADDDIKMLAPDRFAIQQASSEMSWFPGRGDEDQLSKILSMQTADIMSGTAGDATKHEDWLTEQHIGVLANPRLSGLKQDLTVALEGSRGIMEKVLGERMFPPASGGTSSTADPGGPYWAQVQEYYQMDGSGNLVVQPQKKDQMGVFPVIASFMEVYGAATTHNYAPTMYPHAAAVENNYPGYYNKRKSGTANVHVMTAHMAPLVKLWNPYNKPLEMTGYTLVVGNNNSQYGSLGRGSCDDVIMQVRNGTSSNLDSRLPKPMRFEHRYYIPEVTFAPGETKIFALGGNRYLDLEGSYTPWSGKSVGDKANVVGDGWILADLVEGGFRGYSLWDMHFTKPDLYDNSKDVLNYLGGRAIGGVTPGANRTDSGDIQILDTNRPGGTGFVVKPHRTVTWNLKLYKGRVKEGATSGYDEPLVNMKNINTDALNYSKERVTFTHVSDPVGTRFFSLPGGLDSMWARRVSLRHLINEGDDDDDLYNVAGHGTKDIKWLANYNPRSATVGCWPKGFQRMTQGPDSNYFQEPKQQMTVNGTGNGSGGFGLGTPGNYLTGMAPHIIGAQQLSWGPYIGYSDIAGPSNCALFEVPDGEDPSRHFFSIGQLRHANLWIENGDYQSALEQGYGDEDWFSDNMNPAYPIGNSYADPRLSSDENLGRYLTMSISDIQGSYNSTWYDLSWYLNDRLWDRYYFSAKKKSSKEESNNPRLMPYGEKSLASGEKGILENARNQMISGAFNVNSVSVEAWTAFLGSLIGTGDDDEGTPFLRYNSTEGGTVTDTTTEDDDSMYMGYRELNPSELEAVAERMVEEVRKRGPFMSLGDFVNRAALEDAPEELRIKGAMQAAIDLSGVNENLTGGDMSIEPGQVGGIYQQEAFAGDISAAVPGYLTQGDVLARTGHLLTARSDSFKIRAYGESVDKKGVVVARAWCEAVVQRTPDYVNPNDDPSEPAWEEDGKANSEISDVSRQYGRKFVITSFRWVSKGEIY